MVGNRAGTRAPAARGIPQVRISRCAWNVEKAGSCNRAWLPAAQPNNLIAVSLVVFFTARGVRLPKDAGTGGKVVWVEVEDLSRIPTPSSGAAVRPRGHLTWPPDVAGGEPIVPPLPSLQLTSMPMTCTAPLVIHTEEGLVGASKGFSRCTAGKAEQLMDRHCREPCMH